MKILKGLVVFMAFFLHYGAAIRCYNCSLSEQHRCAKSINLPFPQCPDPANLTLEEAKTIGAKAICIKTTKPSKFVNSTHPYTRRFCGIFTGKKDDCEDLIAKEYQETGALLTCNVCDKDLCNASYTVSSILWIIMTACVAILSDVF